MLLPETVSASSVDSGAIGFFMSILGLDPAGVRGAPVPSMPRGMHNNTGGTKQRGEKPQRCMGGICSCGRVVPIEISSPSSASLATAYSEWRRILKLCPSSRIRPRLPRGMSITLRRDVSAYRGRKLSRLGRDLCAARSFRSASAASTSFSGTRTAWRNASPASSALRPARRTVSISRADDNTEEKRISSSERYAKVYNIDYNRCIFCGYCVEAWPDRRQSPMVTASSSPSLNATTLVMRKEDLLVPTPPMPDAIASAKDEGWRSGVSAGIDSTGRAPGQATSHIRQINRPPWGYLGDASERSQRIVRFHYNSAR